jgi:xanthine dehydrogenase accessory factor
LLELLGETSVAGRPLACMPATGAAALVERSGAAGCVLGIVFATAGSTYQKPGALILLDRTGMRHGALSGGCLEPEVEDRARRVSDSRRAEVVDFDTRSDEDLLFGSGTGCRGRIHLLLLPQPPEAPLAEALAQLATSTGPLELALVTDGPETGCGSAAINGKTWCWGRDGQRVPWSVCEPMVGDTALVRVSVSPPPRVVLFGAGPETGALYLFMQRLGWGVSLVEHRGRWLKFAHSAGVENIIEASPDDAAALWRGQHATAAVAMTHNYALDMQHLRECADSDLSYIGLLGPAARRDQMLAELGEEYAKRLRGRLHAPVGLALGGRGPEPLALAIAAELQQHFAHHSQDSR